MNESQGGVQGAFTRAPHTEHCRRGAPKREHGDSGHAAGKYKHGQHLERRAAREGSGEIASALLTERKPYHDVADEILEGQHGPA